jgi:hypothetical protein
MTGLVAIGTMASNAGNLARGHNALGETRHEGTGSARCSPRTSANAGFITGHTLIGTGRFWLARYWIEAGAAKCLAAMGA